MRSGVTGLFSVQSFKGLAIPRFPFFIATDHGVELYLYLKFAIGVNSQLEKPWRKKHSTQEVVPLEGASARLQPPLSPPPKQNINILIVETFLQSHRNLESPLSYPRGGGPRHLLSNYQLCNSYKSQVPGFIHMLTPTTRKLWMWVSLVHGV